ncbi:MAG: carboxymuconolactone decarboxylase family protein [Salinarimonas sp.]|nr:carboxymuconolactone decarboxylase family protein [Salinarimonas sp.]
MRLEAPDPKTLDPQQKQVFDAIAGGPRGSVVGPLAVWLHRAEFAGLAQALGAYCRYHTALEPRLSELAILVTARVWSSEFEWYSHKPIALAAGLSPVAVEGIRRGRAPRFEKEDEAIIHAFALELHTKRRVSDETYARAERVLGRDVVIDLVGLLGYYTLISMTINVFEIPLPDGAEAELDDVDHDDG